MGAKLGSAGQAGMHPRLPGQWHPPAGIRGPRENGAPAQPRYQPGRPTAVTVTVPSRPAVVLRGPAGSPSACRVEGPARLLRVWGMLSAASEELHKVKLPPRAVTRLQRQLKAAIAELEQSVSPALVGELNYLTRQNGTAPATISELRIEYATLLGWTSGLVIAMLDQLQQGNPGVTGQDSAAGQVAMPVRVKLSGAVQPHLVDIGLKPEGRSS
jgi:Protein of unknown function (DUF2587)